MDKVMSRTTKTDPYWVKALRKDSAEVTEWHDHTKNSCDITDVRAPDVLFWQRTGSCGYSISYYGWHNGFYPRPPHSKEIRNYLEGKVRAKWRAQRHDMLKLSYEDLEDYDVKTYQHRHSALWEMY